MIIIQDNNDHHDLHNNIHHHLRINQWFVADLLKVAATSSLFVAWRHVCHVMMILFVMIMFVMLMIIMMIIIMVMS